MAVAVAPSPRRLTAPGDIRISKMESHALSIRRTLSIVALRQAWRVRARACCCCCCCCCLSVVFPMGKMRPSSLVMSGGPIKINRERACALCYASCTTLHFSTTCVPWSPLPQYCEISSGSRRMRLLVCANCACMLECGVHANMCACSSEWLHA